jgi:branched-chain amino acid transport system substrate-binding protein
MNPAGPEPEKSMSTGFFELALRHQDTVRTVAIVGADAELPQSAIAGARSNLKALPFVTVFDRSYASDTGDFAPILRALQATNPDIVYAATDEPDTVGLVRAASELGVQPKLFGGALGGLADTAVKLQLGPLLNGIVITEAIAPVTATAPPELKSLVQRYQEDAGKAGLDPLGYTFPALGYAAGQVLGAAVAATQSLDQDQIAKYLHTHPVATVVGALSFGPDGEWTTSETVATQFQGVESGALDEFRNAPHEPVVWPDAKKTGEMLFPYAAAKGR